MAITENEVGGEIDEMWAKAFASTALQEQRAPRPHYGDAYIREMRNHAGDYAASAADYRR